MWIIESLISKGLRPSFMEEDSMLTSQCYTWFIPISDLNILYYNSKRIMQGKMQVP